MMNKISKTIITVVASAGLVFGGGLIANAATSGSVQITQGKGSFSGTFAYDSYVKPNQTGTLFRGTLRSTTSQNVKFDARVEGYGFSTASSVSNGSVSINKVWFDPAAQRTRTSEARVCEIAVVAWVDYCTTKPYNR
ncbi:hypothetical protein [Mycetocola saprophilus]|uniref:hypothetical protein n=1 Tax=Mycetocola saprophilus TaxID=76636 RepID=UPI003BEFB92C